MDLTSTFYRRPKSANAMLPLLIAYFGTVICLIGVTIVMFAPRAT